MSEKAFENICFGLMLILIASAFWIIATSWQSCNRTNSVLLDGAVKSCVMACGTVYQVKTDLCVCQSKWRTDK